MMNSLPVILQQHKLILFALLFMSRKIVNVNCNHIEQAIETNDLLNQNDKFEDTVPIFSSDSLKFISELLSFSGDKSKIQKIDSNELTNKNIIQENQGKKAKQQNYSNAEGLKILQNFLIKYVKSALSNSFMELLAGRSIKPKSSDRNIENFNIFQKKFKQFIIENKSECAPRAMETGRLFLFKGLKNLLWPLFIGVQIAKSILVALFLPSILGSLGIMVGKRLNSISGYKQQSPTMGDMDFPDTVFPLDDQYKNPQSEASENHVHRQPFQPLTANLNNDNSLSNFGFVDQKFAYDDTGPINTIQTNKNIFKDFLKVPGSSLLLSNYDPFYSPLLSRIDSVFSQFKIEKNNEECRSKLICSMYANPAKYAPYSNLISAQLSRELNELQKPKNDNQEILRFFKYMQAAKSGQDGNDCTKLYESCIDFKDSESPVMITTYNDINKLVEAKQF